MTSLRKSKIVIFSNENDPHVDFVLPEIKRRGLDYVRFHTEEFPQHINITTKIEKQGFDVYFSGSFGRFCSSDVKSVWYRRPLAPIIDSRLGNVSYRKFAEIESGAFVNYVFGLMSNHSWVSDPYKIDDARNKFFQLKLAGEIGFKIPDTVITNEPIELKNFYEKHKGDIILKPIKTQWIDSSSNQGMVIFTHLVQRSDLEKANELQYAPCFFQERIPKDYELRITVVGNQVFSAELHSQEKELTKVDWRYHASDIPYKVHELPKEISVKCKGLVDRLGLKFGAIDMIVKPGGEYIFLEINPNGQWGWIQEKTGLQIRESLVDLLHHGTN